MTPDTTAGTTNDSWDGGFVHGLLTARYYALRHETTGDFFRAAVPSEVPDVVCTLISTMCRAAIDHRLFESSWASLDHLLLCESKQELQSALAMVPDATVQ